MICRPYYQVKNEIFYNPYAAFYWASRNAPHEFPRYDFFDKEFSMYNWEKEPDASWKSLLAKRAAQLRNQYDILVLSFSGGTDSTTVYQTFQENKIHIDEIIIGYTDDEESGQSKKNVEWILNNHWDRNTRITAYQRNKEHLDINSTTYNDEYLIQKDSLQVPCLHSTPAGAGIQNYLENSYGNFRWAQIFGFEKPHIMLEPSGWYATHLNKVYQENAKVNNIEWFFITPDMPELHIKQCHMLKNYIKTYVNPSFPWNSARHSAISPENYYDIWFGCGRNNELLSGMSFLAKRYHENVLKPNALRLLNNDTKNKNIKIPSDYLDKYYSMWQALQTDITTLDYMVRMKLLNTGSGIDDYNGIWSKKYFLGQ
jgi:hypothetical protein